MKKRNALISYYNSNSQGNSNQLAKCPPLPFTVTTNLWHWTCFYLFWHVCFPNYSCLMIYTCDKLLDSLMINCMWTILGCPLLFLDCSILIKVSMKAPEIMISTFFDLIKYKLSSPETTAALGNLHFIGSAYLLISNLFFCHFRFSKLFLWNFLALLL